MTRDDIIRMAHEAQGEALDHGIWSMHVEDLERFAALVAAAEREACARKPLTDEEIVELWSWSMTADAERTANTQQHAFARAIERAHGIGGWGK